MSLASIAIVLVYRSSRVVNFSQVALGGLAGTVALTLAGKAGVAYPLAALAGLGFGAVAGGLGELAVMAKGGHRSPISHAISTVGLAELAIAGQDLMRRIWHISSQFRTGLPEMFRLDIGGFDLDANGLLLIAGSAIAYLALSGYLSSAERGLALRALADSRERCLLLGIPVRSISLQAWSIAGALSAAGAIMAQAAGAPTGNLTPDPGQLLVPLAAAVLAKMRSLKVALAGSLVLEALWQAVVFTSHGSSAVADAALFGFIILTLLVGSLPKRGSGKSPSSEFRWLRSTQQPAHLHNPAHLPGPDRTVSLLQLASLGMLLGLAALLDGTLRASQLVLPTDVAILAMVAISLIVLTGWTGEISLGQLGLAGAGGAVARGLMAHLHFNLIVALPAAALAGGIAATLIGLPALRRRYTVWPVTSLAAAVVVYSLFSSRNIPWLRLHPAGRFGPIGTSDLLAPRSFYLICVLCAVGAGLLVVGIRRSSSGIFILAARDNKRAASAYGIRPAVATATAFAITGALAGLAGCLYVMEPFGAGTAPYRFSPALSLMALSMLAIGGSQSLLGALIGALLVGTFIHFLSFDWQLFACGAALIAVTWAYPNGVGPALFQARQRWLTRSRRRRPVAYRRRGGRLATAAAALRDIEIGVPATERERFVRSYGDPSSPLGGEVVGCSSLGFAFGTTEILHGITISLGVGEIVGVLGPNGSGKTTFLRCLAGLQRPQRGVIRLQGRRLSRFAAHQRVHQGMAVVFGRDVFPSLTVMENLRLAAWMMRDEPETIERGIAWLLELFPALKRRLHVPAGRLSGGEQQMLAIAQGLLARPRVLLIDEMSLGLAPLVVQQLANVLRELAASGVSVLVVEQSVNVASSLCKRLVVLDGGVVVFTGTKAELSHRPELIGSSFLVAPTKGESWRFDDGVRTPIPEETARLPALTLRSVSKSFGAVRALDAVNLSVSEGEILGVFGPNGSGKTTLLDVTSGFIMPDRGEVALLGRRVTRLSPARRARQGLGRLFQTAQLWPSLTAEDAVRLALASRIRWGRKLPGDSGTEGEIRRMAREALAEVGLLAWRDHLVSELSTGLRRLLEVACVLAMRPRVLLLDEPSAGMSQSEREPLADLLVALRDATRATMIVVEHEIALLAKVADRLAFMDLGSVVVSGAPSAVLADPRVVETYSGSGEPPPLPEDGRWLLEGPWQSQRTPSASSG